jgi:hypothetical protein
MAYKKQKEEKRQISHVGKRALDEGYRPGTRAFSAYIASGGNKRAIREETTGRGGRGYFGRKPKRDSTR